MTMSSGFSKKDGAGGLPAELQGIDRLFGRDLRSRGWVIDLARVGRAGAGSSELRNRMDETPDPAMIWVMRGRRR
ncbi:MAG: hypothetical protein ACREF6_10625 [Alphaproteobacteria bacterium]